MKIRWLGQSGYLLTDGISTLCIDPYLTDSVNRIAGRPRINPPALEPEDLQADAVICTHRHADHMDPDGICRMHKEHMMFYAPSDCAEEMRKLGVVQYTPFDAGAKAAVGSFEIEAVFADHTVPAIGVVVIFKGNRFYFTGDTYYHPRLTQVECDFLFVCINGKLGNMDVRQASKLAEEIKPRFAIPNHYGMFASNTEDPEKFCVPNRFVMEENKEYDLAELI